MSEASPANGSGPGLRMQSSASRQTHGSSAQTLIVVQETQVTDQRLKPNTTPASSAPPKRMRSWRASRKVPSAATNSFSAAITASESQKGST